MRRNKWRPTRKGHYGKTLIRQVIACIIIVLLAILLKKMDIAIVNKAAETFKAQVARDYTSSEIASGIKTAAFKVKEVPAFLTASFHDGKEKMAYAPPTDEAAVVSTFGEKKDYIGNESTGFSRGMSFSSDKELQVHAVSGGTVTDIKESNLYGRFIKVEHEGGVTSLYGGCTDIYVKPLDKVKRGEIIAAVASGEGNLLNFELWVDQAVVNPADYIQF